MEYRLLYNAAAHFECAERFPEKGVIEAISGSGMEGFNALCFTLATLSHQAEAARAYEGKETREPIKEEWARLHLRLADVVAAKKAIMEAIRHGVGESDGEVDEVLLELQKKTETN